MTEAPTPTPLAGSTDRSAAFTRGIYRTIRGSLKRFCSLLAITTLGVSIMIGLRTGCEDLRHTVDTYFDQQHIYDINVQSTLGLTARDVDAVTEIKGVDVAEGIYTESGYTTVGNRQDRVNVQSLSTSNIDQPVLIEGTLPEADDEVAVTQSFLKKSKKHLGDTIEFSANKAGGGSETELFKQHPYTITAVVRDPTDLSINTTKNPFRATAGTVYQFYVDESASASSAFTAIHVTVDGASDLDCFSSSYTDAVDRVESRIKGISKDREQARVQELTVDTAGQLDTAEQAASVKFAAAQQRIDRMPAGSAERTQAEEQLAQQKAQLENELSSARAQIGKADNATWYIQDRASLSSYASIDSDSSSIEAIATVFPLIFFIVAVLVSLTTATRMVEEERTLIGLYKALGYSRGTIMTKYTRYALAACLAGGLLGNIIGFILLPLFLFQVFAAMYTLPFTQLGYDIVMSFGSVALFAVGVVGATYLACRHELDESPAALMRPKAPSSGARIFLERIKPVWKHLGFLNKVTARNLFRYKKRMLMTVFGIAGCTALVICGLGIRDTVVSLAPKQYGDITRYSALALTTSDELGDSTKLLEDQANSDPDVDVSSQQEIFVDALKASFGDSSETLQLVVVPDAAVSGLSRYVNLVDEGGNPLELTKGAVYLSKSAQLVLGVHDGDTLSTQDSTLRAADVRITGMTMNYMGNAIYMSEATYKELFNTAPTPNALVINLSGTEDAQIAFCHRMKRNGWMSVSCTPEFSRDFEKNFAIVNAVVVLVTFMAACLSFVVVFTLSNTNISERERELATIKVLGFRKPEVHHYVNKETLILTAIGSAIGIPLGYVLTRSFAYILKMPSLYFDVQIEPVTYAVAVALSFAFTIIVNLTTNRVLNRIDMVGALKSAE